MPRLRAPVVTLRPVADADLSIFFGHQCDRLAIRMAAFGAPDPGDRPVFDAHWKRIRADRRILLRTIVERDEVAGYIVAFERHGLREVGYWLGRDAWGRGIATAALRLLLATLAERPLYARVAADNSASMRVLEKCGFTVCGHERAYADGRGAEIDETVYSLV